MSDDFNFMKIASSVVAGPVGLLVLLFFFLPWVTISCSTEGFTGLIPEADSSGLPSSDSKVEASGLKLATGDAYDETLDLLTGGTASMLDGFEATGNGELSIETGDVSGDAPNELKALDADPTLWLIPLAGLIALSIAGLRFFSPFPPIIAGGTYLLLGIVALGVQIIKYFDLRDLKEQIEKPVDGSLSLIEFTFNEAWWLTMVGLFLIIVAGLVAILLETAPEPANQSAEEATFSID
ncbi:MAG: hypothetical protein H6673_08040 [Anaerolineales bacterium]|nr:hypothetical protein [Anaerolineales bacterium]